MFCKFCGNTIDDDAAFCNVCGKQQIKKPVIEAPKVVNEPVKETVKKEKSKTGLIVGILITLIVLIVGAMVAIIVMPEAIAKSKYSEKIELAEKYFADGDYEKAIAQYEAAIKIDPKKADAYVGLADVYMEMGDEDKALEVLDSIDVKLSDENQAIIDAKKKEIKSGKRKNSKDETAKLDVYVYDANNSTDEDKTPLNGCVVKLNEGHGNIEDSAISIEETDDEGKVSFGKVDCGDYTLVFMHDGFVTDSLNISLDEATSIDKYLSMLPSGDDAVVMVEWNGNQDIDVCFFNANTKERISVGNPMDESGSFIPSDNKNTHFERAYLREFSKAEVRSAYIVDSGAVPGKSSMEADGVRISVFTRDGCIYSATADEAEDGAIWYPFYIYEGEIHDDVNSYYRGDEDGYEWASLTKEGASSEKTAFDQDNEAIQLYEKFLARNASYISEYDGERVDIAYIKDDIKNNWGDMPLYYAYAYIKGADYPVLIITLDEGFDPDDDYLPGFSLVLKYQNGELIPAWDSLYGCLGGETGMVWYKNYLGLYDQYDQMGDCWCTIYRIDRDYNFVEVEPVLIVGPYDDAESYYDGTYYKDWSPERFQKEFEQNYKGYKVYYPANGMTLEKHIDTLESIDIIHTEFKRL